VIGFLVSVAPEGRIDRMSLLPSITNQQPAMALYLPDGRGNAAASALISLGTWDGRIARMTAFRFPSGRFPRHGLPDSVQTA
jgi:hypothetical protein